MLEPTLSWLLEKMAQKVPAQEAIIFEDQRLTYAQLAERANRLANALSELKVGKGDKVALLLYNCPQFLEVVFGAAKIGAVCVPLNYRLKGNELAYILAHSNSSVLIYDGEFAPEVEFLKKELKNLKHCLVVGENGNDQSYAELLKGASAGGRTGVNIKEDDLATIMYTAGTTGLPKGVMLTHRNHLWSCINSCLREGDYEKEKNLITPIPIFHAAGFQRCLISLYLGGKNILVKHFEPRHFLTLVETEKPTATLVVPTLITMLGKFPELARFNRDSIACLMIGAAPSPLKLFQEIHHVFPKAEVVHCYGLTESAATASYLPARDFLKKPGSVGKGYLNTEIRIINEQGKDVPVDGVGEIIVRGPNVMKGYYQDPKATEEAFFDGAWLRTGDLGRFDEDGYLYIVDRKKDMIISGGENVYSQEVENVLCAYEKISEAAVIGVPDEIYGEVIKAVVVPKPGVTITEQEVIAFCRERLAGFKRPRSVVFVDSLPISGANKVMKRVLREKYGKVSGVG